MTARCYDQVGFSFVSYYRIMISLRPATRDGEMMKTTNKFGCGQEREEKDSPDRYHHGCEKEK